MDNKLKNIKIKSQQRFVFKQASHWYKYQSRPNSLFKSLSQECTSGSELSMPQLEGIINKSLDN